MESGLSGFCGLSSWMRYVALGLAILGLTVLAAVLLVPRLLAAIPKR